MRIFISSTFQDLRPEREADWTILNRRARMIPWGMELFASSPEKPLQVCLDWLHMSDAMVLVIGFMAGTLIPETPELTYTRAEFEYAQKLGRPVFALFKTDPASSENKETDPAKHKALEDFKKSVKVAGGLIVSGQQAAKLRARLEASDSKRSLWRQSLAWHRRWSRR